MVNLGSAYGEIQIGTGGAEQSVAGLADKLRSVGQSMSLALTAPLVGLGAAGVMAAASFEQNLNQMQVVSGATEAQLQALSDTALQLGADTSFSAGEASEGMLELAKAGMETEEVLDGIDGTLALAASGNMEVAQAAEISANALNTFGLEASEANRVADLLAAAANSSSVEVTDMAQGMTMAGAVFAANKIPIEDLSTALAILGNNGIKGSDAGTSLKTMLMRLTAPTTEAAGAMLNLGVEVYNADGSMRAFDDIVAQLENSTADLTDEQRNQALTTIFGADAIRAANILIREGSTAYAEMKDQVTQAGAAQEVADAKLQGLAGAIEYAKGTIESTLISAVLPFLDGMSGMIRQVADLIGMFTALPEPVQNAALAFAAVLAVAGPVMLAISGIGAALGFLLSPIGLIVVGVAALAAAWSANFLGIQEATAAVWAAVQPVLQALGLSLQALWDILSGVEPLGDWTYWWEELVPLVGVEAADAVLTFGEALDDLRLGLGYYTAAVMDAGLGSIEAQEALSTLPGFLQPIALAADSAAAAIQEGWGVIVPQVIATVQEAWAALMTLLEPALARLQTAFAGTGTQVAALAPHFEALWVAIQTMWTAVQPIVQMFGQLLAAELAVTAVFAVNLLATAWQSMGAIVGIVLDQITLMLTTVAALLTETVTLVTALLSGDWDTAWQSARNIFQIFANYFKRTLDNMNLLVETVFTAIQTIVLNTLTDLNVDASAIMRQIKTWWDAIWGGFRAVIDPIVGAINGILDAMTNLSNMKFTPPWEGLTPPAWWDPGGWFGGGGAGEPGKNAMGTSFWRGGLSWVGESGPELIDLPRGARVYDAQDSQRMGGRTINITVPVQALNSQLDMVELAHRVAGTILQYEGA